MPATTTNRLLRNTSYNNRARRQSRFPPTPRRQRAAQATTIAPRWKTLWRQHGSFGGTLARIFGPRIWRGRRTPLYAWRLQQKPEGTASKRKCNVSVLLLFPVYDLQRKERLLQKNKNTVKWDYFHSLYFPFTGSFGKIFSQRNLAIIIQNHFQHSAEMQLLYSLVLLECFCI